MPHVVSLPKIRAKETLFRSNTFGYFILASESLDSIWWITLPGVSFETSWPRLFCGTLCKGKSPMGQHLLISQNRYIGLLGAISNLFSKRHSSNPPRNQRPISPRQSIPSKLLFLCMFPPVSPIHSQEPNARLDVSFDSKINYPGI